LTQGVAIDFGAPGGGPDGAGELNDMNTKYGPVAE
jgi:hypothetical protein